MAKKLLIIAGNHVLWEGNPPLARKGVFEVLCRVGCEKMCIISGDTEAQAEVVRATGFEQYFGSKWYCGAPENKREILRLIRDNAMREFNASSKEILVVGDSPLAELHYAARLNMSTALFQSVQVSPFPQFSQYEPTYRIKTLEELVFLVAA